MTWNDDTPGELDPLLRQMFVDHPARAATSDLAGRARQRAAMHARAELTAIARLRKLAFVLTVVVLLGVVWFTLHMALNQSEMASWASATTLAVTSSGYTASELLTVTIIAAAIAVLGTVLSGPALWAGED